jgi:hypothetical protein
MEIASESRAGVNPFFFVTDEALRVVDTIELLVFLFSGSESSNTKHNGGRGAWSKNTSRRRDAWNSKQQHFRSSQ